jgi:large conductance mechanosensitive channel
MRGFVDFIREQGVVGLAVGFILGGAVSKVVTSLVENIIQPLIGSVIGAAGGLNSLAVGPISYGMFLTAFVDFIVVAAVVYFIFRGLKLNKIDKEDPSQVKKSG